MAALDFQVKKCTVEDINLNVIPTSVIGHMCATSNPSAVSVSTQELYLNPMGQHQKVVLIYIKYDINASAA